MHVTQTYKQHCPNVHNAHQSFLALCYDKYDNIFHMMEVIDNSNDPKFSWTANWSAFMCTNGVASPANKRDFLFQNNIGEKKNRIINQAFVCVSTILPAWCLVVYPFANGYAAESGKQSVWLNGQHNCGWRIPLLNHCVVDIQPQFIQSPVGWILYIYIIYMQIYVCM